MHPKEITPELLFIRHSVVRVPVPWIQKKSLNFRHQGPLLARLDFFGLVFVTLYDCNLLRYKGHAKRIKIEKRVR